MGQRGAGGRGDVGAGRHRFHLTVFYERQKQGDAPTVGQNSYRLFAPPQFSACISYDLQASPKGIMPATFRRKHKTTLLLFHCKTIRALPTGNRNASTCGLAGKP